MAYKKFTIKTLKRKLGLEVAYGDIFSGKYNSVPLSEQLERDIAEGKLFPLLSEKAKSELLIMPVLKELKRINNGSINVFSGYPLNVDAKRGLTGFCDFIITKNPLPLEMISPVLAIVEAKNERIELGIGQCGAEMYAASLYNVAEDQKTGRIFGCVTTATEWLFLSLDGNTITIDSKRYLLTELSEILGIFQYILNYEPNN